MKISLTIPKNKKYLRLVKADQKVIGVLPVKNLPFSFRLNCDPLSEESELEISDSELKQIEEDAFRYAQSLLLDYLAASEKTVYDCRDFLKRYAIPVETIEELINYAQEKNYLSDGRYTEMYIQECLLFNKSPEEIRFKLKQKRINAQLIQEKMHALYHPEVKQEVLNNLIEKLITQFQALPEKQCFEKCATFLYRKGFKYDEFENILKAKIYNKT